MKLLTNVYNPSDMQGFSYAFIDLTPELAKLILKRRDAFNAIEPGDQGYRDLAEMQYYDLGATFLAGIPDGTETPETDAGGDYDLVAFTDADLDGLVERTEGDRMVITWDSVYWRATPKHCYRDSAVETAQLDFDTVEKAAQEAQPAAV